MGMDTAQIAADTILVSTDITVPHAPPMGKEDDVSVNKVTLPPPEGTNGAIDMEISRSGKHRRKSIDLVHRLIDDPVKRSRLVNMLFDELGEKYLIRRIEALKMKNKYSKSKMRAGKGDLYDAIVGGDGALNLHSEGSDSEEKNHRSRHRRRRHNSRRKSPRRHRHHHQNHEAPATR